MEKATDCEESLLTVDAQIATMQQKLSELEPRVPTHVRVKQLSDKKAQKQKQLDKAKEQAEHLQARMDAVQKQKLQLIEELKDIHAEFEQCPKIFSHPPSEALSGNSGE